MMKISGEGADKYIKRVIRKAYLGNPVYQGKANGFYK